MGRRKPFVDKKKSTTYNVIYREAAQEDETAEQREWVEKEKGVGVGRPDMDLLEERHHQESLQGRRYPPGHPLSWLEEEEGQETLSEERRKQNLDLGFPDDGYDYLKHLRVLGKGKVQGLSTAEGPSTAAAAHPPAAGDLWEPAPEAPHAGCTLLLMAALQVMQSLTQCMHGHVFGWINIEFCISQGPAWQCGPV